MAWIFFQWQFSDSSTGTITVSGSGTEARTYTDSGSGTVSLSGSGTDLFSLVGTGIISLSGTGSSTVDFTDARSGTISVSGARSDTYSHTGSGSGTVTLSGTGVDNKGYGDSGSGIIWLAGSGTDSFVLAGSILVDWSTRRTATVGYVGPRNVTFTVSVRAAGFEQAAPSSAQIVGSTPEPATTLEQARNGAAFASTGSRQATILSER